MNEKQLVSRLLELLHERHGAESATATAALAWAESFRATFWPPKTRIKRGKKARARKPGPLAWDKLPKLATALRDETPASPLAERSDAIGATLAFDAFDLALMRVVVLMERVSSLSWLRYRLAGAQTDMLELLGVAAGAEAERAADRVRRSPAVSLGLLAIEMSRAGHATVEMSWTFKRLIDRDYADEEALFEALVGIRQRATLQPGDFAAHACAFDFVRRLIAGARSSGAAGINILLHGPPGTGKTEFARSVAEAAGLRLFAVGEADEDEDEPNRYVRLHALKRGQRLLAQRPDSILLFDEMEDLFAQPAPTDGSRVGSKIFVNRMLESNAVPTIWTSNAIADIDPAHLRRMSFIAEMKHPTGRHRTSVLERIARDEARPDGADALGGLAAQHPETTSIARVAVRAARIAEAESADIDMVARALLVGLRGGRQLPPTRAPGAFDPAFCECDPPAGPLLNALAREAAPDDFSLLLSGPPGTGKTALAYHVAETVGRPLIVKRTSDLLSKWVGETEANIAASFEQARSEGAVLFFDEADSLLFDRTTARTSWEVTQVNELLTWMGEHPAPFIAATNYRDRLDPAALRRFDFKLVLRDLSPAAAHQAFVRFFGADPPAAISHLRGLVPGDFAVVARQLRLRPCDNPAEIVHMLTAEAEARPSGTARLGF